MRVVALVVVLICLLGAPRPAQAAPDRQRPVTACSHGLVALTFDDGPSPTVTPRLVRLLERLEVPATFFMVGSRVAASPDTARLVERAGFAIGNHTWAHTDLTTQTDAQIRRALRSSQRELVGAGLHPTPLARPPYGAVDDRVRRVIDGMGLVPVLWTIDSRDWTGLTPRRIRERVLDAVRRHRTNVVLQHDGVTNSPATLRALPALVATLRERGFCFAGLDARGDPTPPVPVPSVSADVRQVDEGGTVVATVRLDRPTSRPTVVRVQGLRPRTVRFPVGDTAARVRLRVPHDDVDEASETVTLTAGSATTSIVVRDLDDPPQVRVAGATVTASSVLATEARLAVRLDHVSGRDVRVVLRSPAGRTEAVVRAGETSTTVTLPVPVGRPDQPVRESPVTIVRAVHADPARGATLTVRPPTRSREQVARDLAARLRLPTFRPSSWF